jgi:hypothetical protein
LNLSEKQSFSAHRRAKPEEVLHILIRNHFSGKPIGDSFNNSFIFLT